MSTTMLEDVRPVSETLSQLLVGLGLRVEQLDSPLELSIDQFDQWTNPRNADTVRICVTCRH
jgi:hypothetical protein